MNQYGRLGFIGCGNMAEALCRGVITAGLYKPASITGSDIAQDRRDLFTSHGVKTHEDNRAVVESSDALILAVKPQHIQAVLENIQDILRDDQLIISIAAGTRCFSIERFTGKAPVVRVMPNTPFLLGKGASAVCPGTYAGGQAVEAVLGIMKTGGIAVEVEEKMMDAVTALSGSGPAYFFYFAELLLDAACEKGLDRATAEELLFQTVEGAAAMLKSSGRTPEQLRKMVTSPGGTTEAALGSFDEDSIGPIIIKGFNAAAKRSEELSAKED